MNEIRTVSVIGMGYIGLPTCAVLASRDLDVIGIDVNPAVVEKVNRGEIHIIEPDLDGLVQKVVANGKLRAFTSPQPADAFIIAVPTPITEDHRPDVTYVMEAARSIAPVLKAGDLVVLESTSPVGTTRQMTILLAELRPDLKFPHLHGEAADVLVAHSPERVLPGKVLTELINNDRSIGGVSKASAARTVSLYSRFVDGDLFITSAESAELVKLTENAYRDVNIAFANELAAVCQDLSLNVWEVIELANRHPRVNILQPGPGVGGHCIAVDPWFIVHGAREEPPLIQTARGVNDGKIRHVIARANAMIDAAPGESIACLGLAFKANIDDFRESPARLVSATLARKYGARIHVVEPHTEQLPIEYEGTGATKIDLETALSTCGVLIVLVDHDAFRQVPLERRIGKRVYDTRGIWPDQPKPAQSIGRSGGSVRLAG